jgi:hypothetical protein
MGSELSISERVKGGARAYIATIFDSMMAHEAFALLADYWEDVLVRLEAKPVALVSETNEADFAARNLRLIAETLELWSDREDEDFNRDYDEGKYAEIEKHLSVITKTCKRPGRIKHLHRFSSDDLKCVYCGKPEPKVETMEECEVLSAARQRFVAKDSVNSPVASEQKG